METVRTKNESGMRELLAKARREFRIPENIDHYSPEDFRRAEKRFLKICIVQGRCPPPS